MTTLEDMAFLPILSAIMVTNNTQARARIVLGIIFEEFLGLNHGGGQKMKKIRALFSEIDLEWVEIHLEPKIRKIFTESF